MKFAETVLVLLLAVHMLGGLRLLVIENLPWREGQKRLADRLPLVVAAVVALAFLARAV